MFKNIFKLSIKQDYAITIVCELINYYSHSKVLIYFNFLSQDRKLITHHFFMIF